jgi:hypothetical protein
MNARIIRLEQSSYGALGTFLFDKEIFCVTLEPDFKDLIKHQIPAGKYECKRFNGFKWKNTFEIIVPGHTAVLFHSGNTEVDTEMCVLLGAIVGKLKSSRAVLNSGYTFQRFLDYTKNVNSFSLLIEEHYGN